MSRAVRYTIDAEVDSFGLTGEMEVAILEQAAQEIGDSDQDEGEFTYGDRNQKVTWRVNYSPGPVG